MRRLFVLCSLLILVVTVGCGRNDDINPDRIYMFYSDSCPHCHDAQEYIDRRYPDLMMERVNVADKNGLDLLFKCAKKFEIGDRVGTPLFCMGDKYIMGWSPANANMFNVYVRPFLPKSEVK